ncbi:MAG: sensor histidine kinase [Spirochaetes bacterium]|jgi:two-component sensor histidine kinase|nr:sensor histidine kinase [Spirochaetota bacterium]
MFKPDDIYIILLVLTTLRVFSALIFAELFFHFRKARYATIFFGWLIYAAGPFLALRGYIVDGSIKHPLFGYCAAVGTFLLLFGLILYHVKISTRWFVLFLVLFLFSLGLLILCFPQISGYISVYTQFMTLLIVFVFVIFKRKWFIFFGGIKSYIWLTLYLLYSLGHAFSFYYYQSDLPLSIRFFLTFTNNLLLLVFLLYFDRERSVKMLVLSEKRVQSSLKEKEVLLKELHHRVKNNLAVITSLIDLQTSLMESDTHKEELLTIKNRINAMSLVHELLHKKKDISRIHLSEYIENLTERILNTRNSKTHFSHDIEQIQLQPEKLIPCGLIINELITNTLKHAFPNDKEGEISIKALKDSKNNIHLSIRDNGSGLPELADSETSRGLGLKLVHNLVLQIHGSIEIKSSQGTEFVIVFPVKDE